MLFKLNIVFVSPRSGFFGHSLRLAIAVWSHDTTLFISCLQRTGTFVLQTTGPVLAIL